MEGAIDYLRRALNHWLAAAGILPALFSMSASGMGLAFFSGKDHQDVPWLNNVQPEGGNGSWSPGPEKGPGGKRSLAGKLIVVGLLVLIIGGSFALALQRAGDITSPTNPLTSSPGSGQVTCQALIDRAMQASGDACDKIGSNQVCYGNNTLMAELVAGTADQFNQRGDVVSVADLRRLAASPLSLASEEWGIAVFKIMANLPRSLPGEVITMVVFGNTTLDNPSNNLQTFYFSSTLGQIECDQVPFDGLMITMPDGAAVSFMINGAEMTLMGNASIKATQNGSMQVSVYSGSAYVAANGQSQIITAGQSTSMNLGGPGGTSATSPPSAPAPLSPEELDLACTLTGQFCSSQEITPVSQQDALSGLLVLLGITTPASPAETNLPNPTSMPTVTPSLLAIPNLANTQDPQSQSIPTATLLFISTDTLAVPPSPTNSLLPPTATNPPPPTATDPPPPTATNPPPPPPTAIPMITICHSTGLGTYNEITIPNVGSGGHWNHPDDIIPAPAGGCP
jgi:hypothetical protein